MRYVMWSCDYARSRGHSSFIIMNSAWQFVSVFYEVNEAVSWNPRDKNTTFGGSTEIELGFTEFTWLKL